MIFNSSDKAVKPKVEIFEILRNASRHSQ